MLHLLLFGAPRIHHDGRPVVLRRTRALALLAYLAATRQPHDRDALLALLWPEFDLASARNNLRRELSILKAALGEEFLVVDRLQIAWNTQAETWLDIAAFQEQRAIWQGHAHPDDRLCAECGAALETGVQLYADEFLAGFGLPDSQAFDEWLFFQREELRQQLAAMLQALVGWHTRAGSYRAGIVFARRWLALDALHEPAQRGLMRLYSYDGQHSAALRQYEVCARTLRDELGTEPEAETRELYEAIKARQARPQAAPGAGAEPPGRSAAQVGTAPQQHGAPPLPRHNLPPQPTPFLGREEELQALARLLANKDARLITIYGPGGTGKTRLAVELAASIYAVGEPVVFVGLQSLGSPRALASTIAEAIGCQLSGPQPVRLQLVSYLRTRRLLLILDNFEHLIDEVELLSAMLAAAPDVRLLVTSREALNLQEEWLYPLQGLPVPPPAERDAIERYSAVQFFAERARRVNPQFSLDAERAGVARICRLVEGMPLALELAAAWAKSLSCAVIAAEIERNLGFLTTRLRNVPERHRSIRATFDYSWALLSEQERGVFMRLAIFRGGFLPEAAAQVAGATLPLLMALVDKSLVRAEGGGRYSMHELLGQYADEQLRQAPVEAANARLAHSTYYLRLLAQRDEAIAYRRQREATGEVAREFENISLAWWQAIAAANIAGIQQALTPFGNLCLYRGFYHEGIAALEQAVQSLRGIEPTPERDSVLAQALNELAWQYIRVDKVGAAQTMLLQSHELYERIQQAPPDGRASDPRSGLAYLALIQGRHADAVRLAQRFLEHSEARGYTRSVSFAWFVLARAALAQGLSARARHAAEQAEAAARAGDDRWFLGYVLNELGHVAVAQARYDDAWRYYRMCYDIRKDFEDGEGMALAMILQARVALLKREYGTARDLYQRGLALFPNSGDRGSIGAALHGLGQIAYAEADYRAAARFFHNALEIARDIELVPLMIALLASAGELLLDRGRPALAAEALLLISRHPAADQAIGARAQQLLVQHDAVLAPYVATAPEDPGPALDTVTRRMLDELAALGAPLNEEGPASGTGAGRT